MSARIAVLDIETQRAVIESFSLFPNYINIDRVIRPARVLCYAAKWTDEDEILFDSAWEDDDEDGYAAMIGGAWELFDEADFLVTFNGDKFDLQWLQAEFGRLEFGRPSPYRSIDLVKIAKRNFGQGLMSKKLQWSAREWLKDQKVPHEGIDLWHEIRYGNASQKAHAQELMMDYNIHDVELTEELFERYLPWIDENFDLYEIGAADDGVFRCTTCSSQNVQKRGRFPTKAYSYQRYYCNNCGSWSKGRKMLYTNELRPV